MNIIDGDILELAHKFDVIVHGCNCFCTMNSGIAKQIRRKYPEAYEEDLKTIKGDRSKLGNYTSIKVDDVLIIVNAYTQYTYGSGLRLDYDALREVFRKIKKDFSGKSIAYPSIGAGLAGGNWNIISTIIDQELEGEHHTWVRYQI